MSTETTNPELHPEGRPRQEPAVGATAARALLTAAIDAGRSVAWAPGRDSGADPYVTVKVIVDGEPVVVTWHTRDTGTYRLSSATYGSGLRVRDITLKRARALILGKETR